MSSQIRIDLSGLLPLGEKRKLLNQFIAHAKEPEVNDTLKDCADLPSIQYNLLKLSLADKFRRPDLIIELLHEDNSSILSGAVSKRWLYEGDSSLTDSGFLLNKLFPNVSYNCRQKVLYKIGRHLQNEEKADKIWNGVEQRYGFNVAFPLLQACSREKINSVVADRKVDLSGYQLVQILQKYPDIGLKYLKNYYTGDHSSTNRYCSPLYYVYENHPDDFLELCINHSDKISHFKFGRSRSTKLIRTYREKLLEHGKATGSLLKFDRIRREFSNDEFQVLFESSLPKEPVNVDSDDMWKWVNTVPMNKQLEMVNGVFMKLYQIKLDDHPEYMSPSYFTLLPDEKRSSIVQWKIENDKGYCWSFKGINVHFWRDEEKKRGWLLLKPSSESVPELQKLLLIEQDVNARGTLSKYLIETCYINEDQVQLLNVLKLLNKRSRNDQSNVRREIFGALSIVMDKMKFSKEHWDIILEMIQVSLVFKDSPDYCDSQKSNMVEKCLAYHLASKLSLNNLVTMAIKFKIQTSSRSWTTPYIKNPADRRTLLELYVKELEHLQSTNNLCSYDGNSLDAAGLAEYIVSLIEEICKFNESVGEGLEPILISSHQWLRDNFEQIAKKEEDRVNKHCNDPDSTWYFARQLVDIIEKLKEEKNWSLDAFSGGSDDLFSKMLIYSPYDSLLMHFLKKNPAELFQNWSTIFSKMVKDESIVKFIKTLKSWNYSTLVAQTIKMSSEIINATIEKDSEIIVKHKCNAVLVLSVLSEPSDFLALVSKFYPTETKHDVFAENSDEDYQVRQMFAKSLVNVTEPHLTFPALEKFCVGDYLKLVVGAFYSQTSRASEVKSLSFLRQKLVNTPVSLQKHIIRQYLRIASVEEKVGFLNEIESSNVSIRNEIFLQANKLFRSSPSQETWRILQTTMEKTSVDDAPIILYLHSTPHLDTVPLEYVSYYIETSLALLRKIEADKIENFMINIESIMDKLPEKTLDGIILREYRDEGLFSSSFCVKYLHNSSSTQVEHRLSIMNSVLQNAIRKSWDEKVMRNGTYHYPTRTLVLSFISSLCLEKINDPSKSWLNNEILQTLLKELKAESTKFFKEILYLELSLLILKEIEYSEIERLRLFGKRLARFTDSLVEKFGGEIVGIINDTIKTYVQRCFYDQFSKISGVIVELIDGILETSKSRHNQIISITFLQNTNPEEKKFIETLERIHKVLKESNDVTVQMCYESATH